MSDIASTVAKILMTSFATDLKKVTNAAIKGTTGRAKEIAVPNFECHGKKGTYVQAYNDSHPGTTVDQTFGAPAFAVEGRVHIDCTSPDWICDGNPNSRKIVSTMVHEYVHACSHGGKGLQEVEESVFKGPGSFMYTDEAITDFFGYVIYTKMGLATDGMYESGYVCDVKDPMRVGVADGPWLSAVFALPAFDKLHLTVAKAYFHGDSLNGVKVEVPKYIRILPKVANAPPIYGVPSSFGSERASFGERIGERIGLLLPICNIRRNAIPVSHCGTLLKAADMETIWKQC